jgi:peptide/nickel transport system substrate-binding protein
MNGRRCVAVQAWMVKMKHATLLFAVLAATLLGVAGCGGSDSGSAAGGSSGNGSSASGSGASELVQPPDGVPAGTFPLPLPVKGQAYNNPQPRDNIRDGGTLTLPIAELGPNFNLFSADGYSNYLVILMNWIAPRLWDYGVTGIPSPNEDYLLSVELVSESPQTLKYTLNPSAKWNDGTPIDWTAFEAAWRMQRGVDARYNPASTAGYSAIDGVRKGERDNEVIVTFTEPTYPFEFMFDLIAHPKSADPEFYRTGWINNLNPELLSGPFVVESLSPQTLVLARNPKWWGDSPKLETVILRQLDDVASVNAFQNHEVDSTTVTGGRATADLLQQISGMQNVQIRRGFYTGTSVYTMGQDSELFKDPVARKAFILGIDRKLLVDIRFQGMSWQEDPPGSVMMRPVQEGYRDNIPELRHDPEQAKRILDDAGWRVGADGLRYKDGRKATFKYIVIGDEPIFTAMARAEQKMAQQIGLDLQIDVRPSSDFSKTLIEGTFDVIPMGWAASDPFGYAQGCQLYCADSESNYSRLGDKEIDALMRNVGTIRDPVQAIAAFNDAEARALQFFGTFPIYNGPSQFAVTKGLANFGPAGFATVDAEDVGWQK